MKSLILDSVNPGGLLDSSVERVQPVFLEPNTLVPILRSGISTPANSKKMMLTQRAAPRSPCRLMVILVNQFTPSSSEIVTGALQFHKRAIIVGKGTFGKGSVQTIIPLRRPAGSALRLTTALYYTPAEVTIHKQGILPDVEVEMTERISGASGPDA